MPLDEYRRKRRFQKTAEPSGAGEGTRSEAVSSSDRGERMFVVQKHAATRLHYDLRLELDGVLLSWAVPKGPSLDPNEKRLAVHVEDHPLDYANFEGTIPKGEYGGGEVIVWDRGTWTSVKDPHDMVGYQHLEFELHGEKLRGGWVLLKMKDPPRPGDKGDNWLLIKRKDEHARPQAEYDLLAARPESVRSGRLLAVDRADEVPPAEAPKGRSKATGKAKASSESKSQPAEQTPSVPVELGTLSGAKRAAMPAQIEPQLAEHAAAPPTGADWVHEIKFDGYRLLARLEQGKARLVTRNFQDWTHRYPSIAEQVGKLPHESLVLDGEVVVLLPSGVSSLQALQNVGDGGASQLVYYVFDLLYQDGFDLRRVPLAERRAALREVLASCTSPRLQISEWFEGDGPEFFRQSCRVGLEGIVSKRKSRPYLSGRTSDWLKTKCIARDEFVIGGYTISEAAPRGIRALLVGYYEGGKLVFAGRVGTGFSAQTLVELRQMCDARQQAKSPFSPAPEKEKGVETRWVRPELVAEIEYGGWYEDGVVRYASFQGLREDKPSQQVSRPASRSGGSQVMPMGDAEMPVRTRSSRPSRGAIAKKSEKAPATGAKKQPTKEPAAGVSLIAQAEKLLAGVTVKLTHPERALYEGPGVTKLDLAAHYGLVAPWMLPHVVDRPLSIVRCPRGQSGKCFFQKHLAAGAPEALHRITIEEKDGSTDEHLYIDDPSGLIALVQMSVLEIHPWGSRRDKLDRPDRLILDLDPNEAVAWQRVIDAAHDCRDRIAKRGLTSFVKTTGGKGLHIVIPLLPRHLDWDAAKSWIKVLVDQMAADRPQSYVVNMSKAARKGKIFLDYHRNSMGSTAVAPYSTRSKPNATVSVPLRWEELSAALKPDHFTVRNLPARLAALALDPWEGFFEIEQTLK